ncbi:hypothetical protein BT96DRAFT_1009174 [Gymnopus androsaceus JB14]|uniref:Uncharacterized protein n=1 Tax=Gymnopus androsaceus JB14 TaxID=1447944 RepID=A0A6A4GD25_9AGAR|nr:hypothetical protein BT96DRAFT_1009174 [Gymnopus androsaceus JB14]
MELSLSAEQTSALKDFLASRAQELPASLVPLLALLVPLDSNLSQTYPSSSPSPQPQPRPHAPSTESATATATATTTATTTALEGNGSSSHKRKITYSDVPEIPSKRACLEPSDSYGIHQTRSQTRKNKSSSAVQVQAYVRPDCPRSGLSAKKRKNTSRFSVADTAALPPKTLGDEAERLLGKLAFGPKASLSNESCGKWILEDLAKRCDRAENSTCVARFVRMLTELYFFAKINGSINNARLLQNDNCKPNVKKWVRLVEQSTNISYRKLELWVQAETRWAILAHSGSLYLLMLIAFQEEDDYLRNHNTSLPVLQAMGNALRSPENSTAAAGRLVQENLLPLLIELRNTIPVAIPTLYEAKLLEAMRLPEFIDAGNVGITDEYFDTFYYHTFRPLPRNKTIWDAFQSQPPDTVLLKTDTLQTLILAPLSLSSVGLLPAQTSSSLPGSQTQSIPDSLPEDLSSDSEIYICSYKEREKALKALVPASLDEYKKKFQERIDSEGKLKEDSCYLKLDRNLIEGKTFQVDN